MLQEIMIWDKKVALTYFIILNLKDYCIKTLKTHDSE